MKVNTTAGGRAILLLEPGERTPTPTAPARRQASETIPQYTARIAREYPDIIMRKRGEHWYQTHPVPKTHPTLPRDPKTGDLAQRGNSAARSERDSRKTGEKPTSASKGATVARAKRRRAPIEGRTVYELKGGGTQPITMNKPGKRK